jgi:hypothetical protein
VPSMKAVKDTLLLDSVCGSREGRLSPQFDGTEIQEWKLDVACMPHTCAGPSASLGLSAQVRYLCSGIRHK